MARAPTDPGPVVVRTSARSRSTSATVRLGSAAGAGATASQGGPSDPDPTLAGLAGQVGDHGFDLVGIEPDQKSGEGSDLAAASGGGRHRLGSGHHLGHEHGPLLDGLRRRETNVTIPRRSFALAAVMALAFVSAACGDDDEGGGEAVDTSTSTSATTPEATETEVVLEAPLSGKDEVPGPGVTDGTGVAEVTIKGEELCYKLAATMGEMPTAAHIHQGAKGAAGDVFINLMPTFAKGESAFTAESCISDATKVADVSASPDGFYVNIHTAEHPNGALRGQLAKAKTG